MQRYASGCTSPTSEAGTRGRPSSHDAIARQGFAAASTPWTAVQQAGAWGASEREREGRGRGDVTLQTAALYVAGLALGRALLNAIAALIGVWGAIRGGPPCAGDALRGFRSCGRPCCWSVARLCTVLLSLQSGSHAQRAARVEPGVMIRWCLLVLCLRFASQTGSYRTFRNLELSVIIRGLRRCARRWAGSRYAYDGSVSE